MSFEKPRQIAARALQGRGRAEAFVEDLLDAALTGTRLAPLDRRLAQELTFGCVRWEATLDWLIARKTEGRQQKAGLQILLRLGLYQMFWLDRVPEHAAVHETVELAKQLGFGPQAGFLNAVLRGCARERDAIRSALAELRVREPHLGWSHPQWLVERWQARFGGEDTRRLMEWNNTPPGTFARVNTLKCDAGKLLELWRNEGVDYDFCRHDWFGENLVFILKAHSPLANLESFRQGGFYIQDPSTLLAVHELDPQPGETLLDLCAAPGGKTSFIAQLMENRGRIVAADISAERLELLRQNSARLGTTIVEPALLDDSGELPPTKPPGADPGFDRVLVDAPCSNTGVLRRRVDLRWRLRPEEIERQRVRQRELLKLAASRVRPGGTLVFSTCSLEPEENREVVAHFLREQTDFTLERDRELLPFHDGVDGAYVARLRLTGTV